LDAVQVKDVALLQAPYLMNVVLKRQGCTAVNGFILIFRRSVLENSHSLSFWWQIEQLIQVQGGLKCKQMKATPA